MVRNPCDPATSLSLNAQFSRLNAAQGDGKIASPVVSCIRKFTDLDKKT
jgi:hypothetical protein